MQNQTTDLFLLTQQFPYESGEEFIGNEISFLSENFSKIYILPTLVRDFSVARKIPANVEIIKFENPTGHSQIGLNFIRHLPEFLTLFGKEVKSAGIDLHTMKYLTYHIPLALQVKRRISDLIQKGRSYSFYSYWMDTNAFALVLLKHSYPKLQFYIRTHSGDLYDERHSTGFVMFRKSVYENASLIAPISHHGTQYINQKWPHFSVKTKTFHLGVKQQSLNPIPFETTFRIVSCSSINGIKRLDKIMEVISHLLLNIEWIHFGGKVQAIEILQKEAEKTFKDNISFSFRGHISNSDLMKFYKTEPCDLFINLSQFEGIPVSIMEATSFGLPIISNDVGGVKEIVGEKTGILVAPDEKPELIAEKLTAFLNSGKSRSQAFRENVYTFWKANFNAGKNYKKFIDEIRQFDCSPILGSEVK